jgi:hypothetical protein
MLRSLALAAICTLALSGGAAAQPAQTPAPTARPIAVTPKELGAAYISPAPDPKDVASPETIVKAVYAVISGPAGQTRNWNRLRSLMPANGRFMVIAPAKDGSFQTHFLTLDQYVAIAEPRLLKEGFYEHGVIGHVAAWGHIATVESPYESRHAPGAKPFARGINRFDLTNDGKRWWIVQIIWEGETATLPLPADAERALATGR